MTVYVGSNKIAEIYKGETLVLKAYKGDALIFDMTSTSSPVKIWLEGETPYLLVPAGTYASTQTWGDTSITLEEDHTFEITAYSAGTTVWLVCNNPTGTVYVGEYTAQNTAEEYVATNGALLGYFTVVSDTELSAFTLTATYTAP